MNRKLVLIICALYFLSMGAVAKIIEVAPADARMTTMIVGGGAPAAAGGAVEITGLTYTDQSDSQGASFAVTVPADATAVIVVWATNIATSCTGILSQLNFDNGSDMDFTQIIERGRLGDCYRDSTGAYYMTSGSGDWPGAGAKTLYWRFETSADYGVNIAAFFVKGINTSSPIVDSDYEDNAAAGSFNIALDGVGSGDMSVISFFVYDTGTVTLIDADPAGQGQTVIWESTTQSLTMLGTGYEVGDGTVYGETATSGSDGSTVVVAFALNAE